MTVVVGGDAGAGFGTDIDAGAGTGLGQLPPSPLIPTEPR